MIDLHRHDEFSTFDGFGKASELAKIAKENGLEALGIANHGNVNGLIEHYVGCKNNDMKPILGCEVYFQQKFDKDSPRYHLCLFVKNIEGYKNLNRIIYEANAEHFYNKPIVTFESLKNNRNGIICTSACIGSYFSQMLVGNNIDKARNAMNAFKKLFGEDFYVEIMPYKLPEKNLQETTNEKLMKLATELDVKMILTSDSHYGLQEDFSTYLKMHAINGHEDFGLQYDERYMPKRMDLYKRFVEMHGDKELGKQMYRNMKELNSKVEDNVLDNLDKGKIIFEDGTDSNAVLMKNIKNGLKSKGCFTKEYIERAKIEYNIIKLHGFADYFLIVQDYVKFAKDSGIKVGPGRGSVCNSLVAYALDITEVDPIFFKLDFTRFLREDKKKMPDIDLDFETDERQRVIEYIIEKYKGKSAQICSYGLYKVDNCLNDLFKVCGVEDKDQKLMVKGFVNEFIDMETKTFDNDNAMKDRRYKQINKQFDNIIEHFVKMYKKVRFIGTHAAGVAIVGSNILDYVAVERRSEKMSCVYDMENLEKINVIKFDMLGLRTMTEIKELETMTGHKFSYEWFDDQEVYERFHVGDTDGIFQFERKTVKDMLVAIDADNFEDIIAANAMNRPGPLQLKMPDQYAENKKNVNNIKNSKYYEQTKDTYGTVVYQEQICAICKDIGELPWSDIDKVLKFLKGNIVTERILREREVEETRIRNAFVEGAKKNGMNKEEATEVFNKILTYSFNKGHATGYSMVSFIMMWYKVHYQENFWLVKLKYAPNEADFEKYKLNAVVAGNIILLPHVNGSADFSIIKYDGDNYLQEGLRNIKNVGEKAAELIEQEKKKNGKFKSYDDFVNRCKGRCITSRVIEALNKAGALEFDKTIYINRVKKYNSALYTRGLK